MLSVPCYFGVSLMITKVAFPPRGYADNICRSFQPGAVAIIFFKCEKSALSTKELQPAS
jgi:hypothetical protein